MSTAIKRLEELLDQKDAEISELKEKLRNAERMLEGDPFRWLLHTELAKEQRLPVPRLELCYEPGKDGWSQYKVKYRLVVRHFIGDYIAIPISETKVSGGRPTDEPWGPVPDPILGLMCRLPLRDGAHIQHDARHLNLPAYAVLGDKCEPIPAMLEPAPYEQAGW